MTEAVPKNDLIYPELRFSDHPTLWIPIYRYKTKCHLLAYSLLNQKTGEQFVLLQQTVSWLYWSRGLNLGTLSLSTFVRDKTLAVETAHKTSISEKVSMCPL